MVLDQPEPALQEGLLQVVHDLVHHMQTILDFDLDDRMHLFGCPQAMEHLEECEAVSGAALVLMVVWQDHGKHPQHMAACVFLEGLGLVMEKKPQDTTPTFFVHKDLVVELQDTDGLLLQDSLLDKRQAVCALVAQGMARLAEVTAHAQGEHGQEQGHLGRCPHHKTLRYCESTAYRCKLD